MNFVAVAIVLTIVLGNFFNKSRHLIGFNFILLCYENNRQITQRVLLLLTDQSLHCNFYQPIRPRIQTKT